MTTANPDSMRIAEIYQPIFRKLGIDAKSIFTHPEIRPWRDLNDRQNCTLDTTWEDGSPVRFHIKRFPKVRSSATPADVEVNGIRALQVEDIPTAPLVGWGRTRDLRSFVITQDLTGYVPADKLISTGTPFDRIIQPTAKIAANLHNCGLHHQDMYLCHFYVKFGENSAIDVRLIDAARVGRMGFLSRTRWIVKDLAQFWFSTMSLPITQGQRMEWLDEYAEIRNIEKITKLQLAIQRKSDWIAAHDARLRVQQPKRNISIPDHRASG